jgi:hypothetical protein
VGGAADCEGATAGLRPRAFFELEVGERMSITTGVGDFALDQSIGHAAFLDEQSMRRRELSPRTIANYHWALHDLIHKAMQPARLDEKV